MKIVRNVMLVVLATMLSVAAQGQKVMRDDYHALQVKYETGALQMAQTTIDGRAFTVLTADGCMASSEVGAPNLPTFSSMIETPLCGEFVVTVSDAVYDTVILEGAPVVPLQPSRSKSDMERHALTMTAKIYATDAYYGMEEATVEQVGVARDRNLARLQFSPVRYNPVAGKLIVCRSAVVTVTYGGVREAETRELFSRYHSPAFASGDMTINSLFPKEIRTTAPIRYLIVAHSSFRGQMDSFVQWKRRKGFLTDIVYTDDAGVGTTSTAIANYVKSQYTGATASSPAPTYLLLVGDHEQIPAFAAQVSSPSSDHITDLYYTTWTSGDHIPDCYYGRFSAQNVSQLTPQIEKTLMYEQYTFADPSFLDRAVMVAGVDGGSSGDFGYTHADPAMDYAITNYINGSHGWSQVMYFKNNTSIVPTGTNVTVGSSASSNSATVRNYYNQGAGWINYSAHGSATSWGTPNFTTSHAAAMTNTQKFGIMIGNCCLTNKFETSTCLGESVLRKGDYCGAVGYIGGSNSTYWNEDFYWAVGLRSGIGPSMSMAYISSNLGAYDRINHTHSEAYSQWVKTQGELMFQGNMAVEGSSSNYKYYYWEIYHLMGDPSLMPYLTQAQDMTMTAPSTLAVGATSLTVTAAPYAYVALTDTATHTLKAAGFANASGTVTLTIASGLTVGGYELAASAQQYKTTFRTLSVVPTQGAYAHVVSVTPQGDLTAGSTVQLTVKIANLGNSIARNVAVSLTSNNSALTLSTGSLTVSTIASGDTVTRVVNATVGSTADDGTQAVVTATTNWSNNTTPSSNSFPFTLKAPVVAITVDNGMLSVMPGSSATVAVTVTNSGHAALGSSQLTLSSSNSQLTVTAANSGSFTLAAGATVTRQFTLQAASTMAMDLTVPLTIQLSGPMPMSENLNVFIGENSIETFEGGHYTVQGWTQGTYPWEIVSDESHEGNYSARSSSNLSHGQTSEMSITMTVPRADSISFYYKVSSEANYDKFHFYIDGTEKVVNSGLVNWTRAAFAVTPGQHTFTFSYSKDVSVNSNSDCAWIDNVSLPRPLPNYVVTVSANHGTATGAGSYLQGETAVVGVYPQAGYAFVQWNDGNVSNPRQVTVNGNMQFVATLSQGGVTTVHDTTVVTHTDTVTVTQVQIDTVTLVQMDTVTLVQMDTVTLVQMDTVTQYDTVLIDVPVNVFIHDTTVIVETDTLLTMQYDTVYNTLYDTVYSTLYDTVYSTLYDTVYNMVVDTVYSTLYDTVYSTQFDTVYSTQFDTVYSTQFDTVYSTLIDTVDRYIYDTTLLTDTLWLYDTVYIHDTIFIHDTIYVTENGIDEVMGIDVKVFQREGCIVVEGAEGYVVNLYDAVGRLMKSSPTPSHNGDGGRVIFDVSASGVYLVRVGELPARRIVVIR